MSEAIEHVVSALGDVEEEMRQAFLARDKGRTGALPGSNFKVNYVYDFQELSLV